MAHLICERCNGHMQYDMFPLERRPDVLNNSTWRHTWRGGWHCSTCGNWDYNTPANVQVGHKGRRVSVSSSR